MTKEKISDNEFGLNAGLLQSISDQPFFQNMMQSIGISGRTLFDNYFDMHSVPRELFKKMLMKCLEDAIFSEDIGQTVKRAYYREYVISNDSIERAKNHDKPTT